MILGFLSCLKFPLLTVILLNFKNFPPALTSVVGKRLKVNYS